MFITPRSFLPTLKLPKFVPHFRSFLLGAVVAGVVTVGFQPKEAEAGLPSITAIADSLQRLTKLKKNLEGDVKNLTADAKTLFGDKDNLLAIKDQLVRLATETKAQIDSIQTLVGTVEGHIKTTQVHIQKTAKDVDEIDEIKKKLGG